MLPLDPVAESPVNPLVDRLTSIVLVITAGVFVYFLLQVQPDPRGHGTHEQFGMRPCGWVVQYRQPCPTCGVTTSASHLVRLELFQAVKTQPFGTALAGFGLWIAGVAGWCLVRRRSFLDYLLRLPQAGILLWGLVLLLGSWAYLFLTFEP